MAFTKLPEQDTLKQLLRYDADSGLLFWLRREPELFSNPTLQSVNAWNATYADTPAINGLCGHGYRRGSLLGNLVSAHRVIWKLIYGYDPVAVDHINRIRHDNRLTNLREVTPSQNARNRNIRPQNKSGVAGVHKLKGQQSWQAGITINGQRLHLGTFPSFEQAAEARRLAEKSAR